MSSVLGTVLFHAQACASCKARRDTHSQFLSLRSSDMGKLDVAHMLLNPPWQAIQHLLCICVQILCWMPQNMQPWLTLHLLSQEAGTQFWTMGWATETLINLSKCCSKEGSLKWFCVPRILWSENEIEWRKAASQFKLGRWSSLTTGNMKKKKKTHTFILLFTAAVPNLFWHQRPVLLMWI